jgi:glutathione synthase/RimK-type ligase-like ATP-grasp enzyme
MILIISNTQDLTSDFVVREITRRNLPFARLNTDEFPSYGLGLATFGLTERPKRLIHWENRKSPLDFDRITAVLYRRPVPPIPHTAITNDAIKQFCVDESYDFLRGLWYSLDCHWISDPLAIRKAEHKVYQLMVAQGLPFVIPKTVITNDPSEAEKFFHTCANGMIVKPLYLGFINQPENPLTIFTTVVSDDDLKDIGSVRVAPCIFQERIWKCFDIRVTIVGERVFAARIEVDSLPPNIPDWRFAPIEGLRHKMYDLPADIENACLELVKRLGLDFGAIDLAMTEDGTHVFFEINPNGQWAWLETALNFPISRAIVDRLLSVGATKQ